MPTGALQHRQATGRFYFVLQNILRKKLFIVRPTFVFFLEPGSDTAVKGCLRVMTSHVLFCERSAVFHRTDRRIYKQSNFGIITAVSVVVMSLLLLACGDVETNPGPNTADLGSATPSDHLNTEDFSVTGKDGKRPHHDGQLGASPSQNQEYLGGSGILKALKRIEEKQDRSAAIMESSMHKMQAALNEKLEGLDSSQNQLRQKTDELQTECLELRSENASLRESLKEITQKYDYLENQNRRNNLLFFGIKRDSETEDWDRCEKKVREVIRVGMGVDEAINIERAHRSGKDCIIVKILSYKQKMLILRSARNLKNSQMYRNVYVREDFSSMVRQKRNGLKAKAKELYEGGQRPKLRFDKLINGDDVYLYDLDGNKVERVEKKVKRKIVDAGRRNSEGNTGVDGVCGSDECDRHVNEWDYDPFGFAQLWQRADA